MIGKRNRDVRLLVLVCLKCSFYCLANEIPPPSPLCQPQNPIFNNLTLYFAHPIANNTHPLRWGNHNMGDLAGEVLKLLVLIVFKLVHYLCC
eukprot:m.139730 g.139730  ORF g.139730 m.139730 type:complete len:92 (-) comp14809_c0_seq5:123-398(-)